MSPMMSGLPGSLRSMEHWVTDDRAATVALLSSDMPEGRRRRLLLRAVESGSSVAALREELGQPTLLDDPLSAALEEARARIREWESSGITVLAFGDPEYPVRLRGVHDMPGLLFARGATLTDDTGVAVVGSRKASRRGLTSAYELAGHLAAKGISVVSGLAAGIDTAAHRGALAARGRTVGVIGTGIRHAYPPENRRLQSEVAEAGVVLSQFLPDTPPDRHTFPARNATMSGYALATVIVEAGERSGARIQARQAVEHGRPVVLFRSLLDVTEWARDFAARPDVHVVEDTARALAVLDDIVDRPHQVQDLLGKLTAGL